MKPLHKILITICAVGIIVGFIATILNGRPDGNDDEIIFLDIAQRNYDSYKPIPDSVKTEIHEHNLLLPYIYVIDNRYPELRISEAEALKLGVSAETYNKTLQNCLRSKEFFKDTTIRVLGMDREAKFYDAVRAGAIDPDRISPVYHPKVQSIRKR